MSEEEVKIHMVPRAKKEAGRKKNSRKDSSGESAPNAHRWIIYVCVMAAVAAALVLIHLDPPSKSAGVQHAHKDMSSTSGGALNDAINRHLQDAQIKRQIMMQTRAIENMRFKDAAADPDNEEALAYALPDTEDYGVHMETDNTAERIYEDLHGEDAKPGEMLPVDKINARLADRKWLNETEREERIAFIANLIRGAYERGYELQFDQDLVVTGVRKLNKPKIVSISQVMDRLTKQGY